MPSNFVYDSVEAFLYVVYKWDWWKYQLNKITYVFL